MSEASPELSNYLTEAVAALERNGKGAGTPEWGMLGVVLSLMEVNSTLLGIMHEQLITGVPQESVDRFNAQMTAASTALLLWARSFDGGDK